MQHKRLKRFGLLTAVLTALAVSTACAPADPETAQPAQQLPAVDRTPFKSTKAILDEDRGEVVLPLDKYSYTPEEFLLVNSAVAYLQEDCVKAAGQVMPVYGGDASVRQDLRFGQWSRPLAAKNGFLVEVRTIKGIYDSGAKSETEASRSALNKCTTSVGRAGFPDLVPGMAGSDPTQSKIMNDSYALTVRDPEFVEFRKKWVKCIDDKGIKLGSQDSGSWAPDYSGAPKEVEIKAALETLDCKEQSGGVSLPYDIFAQYQAALIKKHQASLNQLAKEKSDATTRARTILREHGVSDARL